MNGLKDGLQKRQCTDMACVTSSFCSLSYNEIDSSSLSLDRFGLGVDLRSKIDALCMKWLDIGCGGTE